MTHWLRSTARINHPEPPSNRSISAAAFTLNRENSMKLQKRLKLLTLQTSMRSLPEFISRTRCFGKKDSKMHSRNTRN